MSKQFWANLVLCIFLGSLAIFSVTKISSALTPKGLFVSEPQPSSEAAPLMEQVVLAKYLVGESKGHVIEADFVISNDSVRDVKNLDVLCEFYDERGSEFLDRKRWTLYETVPAGQTVSLSSSMKRFVNSKSRVLRCRLVDFQLVKEALSGEHKTVAGSAEPDSGRDTSDPAPTGH